MLKLPKIDVIFKKNYQNNLEIMIVIKTNNTRFPSYFWGKANSGRIFPAPETTLLIFIQ